MTYFRVRSLSDGSFLLELRVLVPPKGIPARVMKMLDQSAENLKKGVAPPPIDLTPFRKRVPTANPKTPPQFKTPS